MNESDLYRMIDQEKGFVEYKTIAADTKCKTYYPNGYFEGYLVPHEEDNYDCEIFRSSRRGKSIISSFCDVYLHSV